MAVVAAEMEICCDGDVLLLTLRLLLLLDMRGGGEFGGSAGAFFLVDSTRDCSLTDGLALSGVLAVVKTALISITHCCCSSFDEATNSTTDDDGSATLTLKRYSSDDASFLPSTTVAPFKFTTPFSALPFEKSSFDLKYASFYPGCAVKRNERHTCVRTEMSKVLLYRVLSTGCCNASTKV